jgi:hypothetical protein
MLDWEYNPIAIVCGTLEQGSRLVYRLEGYLSTANEL